MLREISFLPMRQTMWFEIESGNTERLEKDAQKVNATWNYVRSLQQQIAWKPLSAKQLLERTVGYEKEIDLNRKTVDAVCFFYVSQRKKANKNVLPERDEETKPWIPASEFNFNVDSVEYNGENFTLKNMQTYEKSRIKYLSFTKRDTNNWCVIFTIE